ncbi:UDP-Glycosyltransferase/glycogen phosphorylase [Aureobasidium subglaciale]|nr:UDP-Glycosyltransferase/glycogen phosphorylase [Aureobasidium subglaciale]
MKNISPIQSTYQNEDPPPAYSSEAPNVPDALGVGMRDDGRMDVDVDSSLGRRLTRIAQSHDDDAAPSYTSAPSVRESTPIITCPARLNIVIQVVGSRGDVQPFVALGCELQQKHGHRVRIATHAVFEDFVRNAGLEFHPIGGDPADLMAYIVKNPGLIPSLSSVRAGDIGLKRRMLAEILDGCWASCYMRDAKTQAPFVADAIIANPPSFGHVHCAQALGIPLHIMFTMPWTSTRAFAHPLANLKYSSDTSPKIANLISYGVVEWMTWQGIGDIVNKWRTKSLDLEPVPSSEGPLLLETLSIPHTYCWSPALVPRPSDWPQHIDVCGFFFRESPSYKPPADLSTFLAAGPMPVYIGFGSIVIEDPKALTELILEAVRMTGVRALVSRGWSKLGEGHVSNDSVFYLDDCPHEWLFDHVAAVVHHGGAGTTACGLSKGVPSFLVPFFGDQPFWGMMVAASGAGPESVPYSSLTSLDLAHAITTCLEPSTKSAAMRVADKMRQEEGVKAAVQSFHAQLSLGLKCDVLRDEAASWTLQDGDRAIKLSKRAAAMLVRETIVKPNKLSHYQSKPIIVDPKRWEPVSAVVSASLHTAGAMGRAAAGVVSEPYQMYKESKIQAQNNPSEAGTVLGPSEAIRHSQDSSPQGPKIVGEKAGDEKKSLNGPSEKINFSNAQGPEQSMVVPAVADGSDSANRTRQLVKASAKSAGKLLFSPVKGLVLDIPLAAVEGMWAVPHYHDPRSYQSTPITDWKSGGMVAGKSFVHGVQEGMTDIFIKTYAGKKKEGAKGVAKGLSIGFMNLTMKTVAGTLGLIAYPCQGVYKSIHTALHTKAKKVIEQAKLEEGEWLVENRPDASVGLDEVIRRFLGVRSGKGKGRQ